MALSYPPGLFFPRAFIPPVCVPFFPPPQSYPRVAPAPFRGGPNTGVSLFQPHIGGGPPRFLFPTTPRGVLLGPFIPTPGAPKIRGLPKTLEVFPTGPLDRNGLTPFFIRAKQKGGGGKNTLENRFLPGRFPGPDRAAFPLSSPLVGGPLSAFFFPFPFPPGVAFPLPRNWAPHLVPLPPAPGNPWPPRHPGGTGRGGGTRAGLSFSVPRPPWGRNHFRFPVVGAPLSVPYILFPGGARNSRGFPFPGFLEGKDGPSPWPCPGERGKLPLGQPRPFPRPPPLAPKLKGKGEKSP